MAKVSRTKRDRQLEKQVDEAKTRLQKTAKEGGSGSCRAMFSDIAAIEWGNTVLYPQRGATFSLGKTRKQYLDLCVNVREGNRPTTTKAGEEDVRPIELHGKGLGKHYRLNKQRTTKQLEKRAETYLNAETIKKPCRKTVGALLDVNAAMGARYSAGETSPLETVRQVNYTKNDTLKRCLLDSPRGKDEDDSRAPLDMQGAYRDRIPGGKAAGRRPSDFNQHQLKRGLRVEREHTNSDAVAREIAMDHLTEDPNYYTKLATLHIDGAKRGRKPSRGKKA